MAVTRRHRLHRTWLKLPAGLRRSRMLVLLLAAAAVLFLAGSVVRAQFGESTAQNQTAAITDQRDAAGAQAANLATQIQTACNAGELKGAVCQTAAQVAAQPIPGPAGAQGDTGVQGATGPKGEKGDPGADSTVPGPAGAQGESGDDSTVPGPKGDKGDPGADSTVPGPVGPQGRPGSPATSYTSTFPDGSTQTCTRSGGTDDTPTYLCSEPVPASDGGLLGP